MFASLKRLYSIFNSEQRRRLIRLQGLVALMAFAELASVVSIGPFMAVVGDMDRLQGDGLLAKLYVAGGFADPATFLFWLGVGVLVVLTLAASISMFTTWRLNMYASQVGAELSARLYKHWMSQPWLFHADGNSAHLTNKISQECARLTNLIIVPFMRMNSKAIMAAVLGVAVLLLNPLVALCGLALFCIAYFVLYKVVRRRLIRHGQLVTETNRQRFKLMNEGFGGIKDTLLLGRQTDFNRRFEDASQRMGKAQGRIKALSEAPRYAVELLAFGAVILLVLYLLAAHQGDLGAILPLLAVYALAGFKMLPAFQQIYSSVTQIRGNLASFENLEADLRESYENTSNNVVAVAAGRLGLKENICLEGASFQYPSKEQPALKNLDLIIPANAVIGLVGPSGSGKSTAIDILLGLLQPETGQLKIDDQPITDSNRRAWQNSIGFVPQNIFLADASIRENIAFGIPPDEIDDEHVRQAASMAHLEKLIASLPDGLDTRVGERGIQLSGGQRQRIGIARALYDDAEVLILDEATSALDGITEKLVMDAIHDFSGKKTIIMIAHRLVTVRPCHRIYLMEAGEIVDSGTYEELVQRNPIFKRMAEHT